MQIELGEIIGRKVDLGTFNSLKERIRERVLNTALMVYERK